MSDGTDADYFYKRAEAALELAQRAVHPGAVKAHYTLAGYYLDRVYGGGQDLGRDPGQDVARPDEGLAA